MRIVWATDTHLESADNLARSIFAQTIVKENADILVLTGDVSNSKLIERLLKELQGRIDIPIYFNLGNHDYYGSSISKMRRWAKSITERKIRLNWIEAAGVVDLGDSACLIGVDGWGDGQLGLPAKSSVLLNDWDLIEEFSRVQAMYSLSSRIDLLGKLGRSSADTIRAALAEALPSFDNILLMTHVPPWKEATWHDGALSNDEWLPWFSCKSVGDVIIEEVAKHPGKKVTVLCGHCFDYETELLTRRGWTSRKNLTVGDEVATLNLQSGALEYNEIQAFADHQWDGPMHRISSRNIDLLVTPEHGLVGFNRYTGAPELFKASEWTEGEKVFKCAGTVQRDDLTITDDEIRLAIWVAADGGFEHQQVRFHLLKQRKIDRLRALLERMNIPFSSHEQAVGTVKIGISNQSSIIPSLFDAKNKTLPIAFRDLSPRQASILLEEYQHTDGWRSSFNGIKISSSKEAEIDLLQELAAVSGRRSTKINRGASGFLLTINARHKTRLSLSNVEVDKYVGPVWCASVENGTLLVRRGGKTCITQNTHGVGYSKINDQIEVFTGGARYRSPEVQKLFDTSGEAIAPISATNWFTTGY
jgi:predicted phosphohydrolase